MGLEQHYYMDDYGYIVPGLRYQDINITQPKKVFPMDDNLKLFRGYLAEANKNLKNKFEEYKTEREVATRVGHQFEKMYIQSKLDAIDGPLGELKFLLKQFDEYFSEK